MEYKIEFGIENPIQRTFQNLEPEEKEIQLKEKKRELTTSLAEMESCISL